MAFSSDNVYRGDDTSVILTDELDRFDTELDAMELNKASTNHNHDGVYAPVNHTHSGYAASDHTHTPASIGAASENHTHTPESIGAAKVAHTHADKADLVNGVVPISQIPNEVKEVRIVANIAARNALTGLFAGLNVYVTDATGDSTVSSGGAYYLYNGSSWIKTAESESLDLVLSWANIQGKPTSLPANGGNADTVDNKHASDFATAGHTHTAADVGASPTGHTHSYNDLTNKPTIPAAVTVDSALSSTSTNPVQNKVINTALSGKAASSHTHDDRYYTESEMNTKLSSKADSSHTHGAATTSTNGFMSSADKTKLNGIATGANKTTVDSALSSSSTNPVQNKVVNSALAGKAASVHNHNSLYSLLGHIHSTTPVTTANEDLNNYNIAGTYSFAASYQPVNRPAGTSNGWLVVIPWTSNETTQTVKQFWLRHGSKGTNDHEVYVRTKIGDYGWSDWTKFFTTKDLKITTGEGDVYAIWTGQDVVAKFSALTPGIYTAYSRGGSSANTTNAPNGTEGFRYLGHKTGEGSTVNYGWIMAFGSAGSVYVGYLDGGTWKGWRALYKAIPDVLWSGALYMTANHTVTPTKKLSECEHGWMLLWSDYDESSSTANDGDFVTTMIPKWNPSGGTWSGKSFYCDIPRYIGADQTDVTTEGRIIKMIYIYDNKIVGHAANNKGIRTDVVLRAIYEF